MLAHLSAFEVLNLCVVVAFVAALFGWLGGAGGTFLLRYDLARTKALVTAMTMSARGEKGQAIVRENRERMSKADLEAEKLALQLRASAAQVLPQKRARGLRQVIADEGLPSDEDFSAEIKGGA